MKQLMLSPPLRKSRRFFHRVIVALSILTLTIRLLDPAESPVSLSVQMSIWFIFLVHATLYTRIIYKVHNVWRYHRDEWFAIVFWNPLTISINGPPPSLDLAHRIIEHAALVSQFLGLMAHVWIVARSFTSQWGKHPFFCGALCMVSITALIAALLKEYEPATFPDWPTTLWFCLETISTVGYGDVVPHGLSARILSFVLIVFGGGVYTVVLAFIGQWLIDRVEWRHPIHRKRDLRKQSSTPTTEELLTELIQKVDLLQKTVDNLSSRDKSTPPDE